MNSDEVRTRLAAVFNDDWRQELEGRISKASKALRPIITQVIDAHPCYTDGPEKRIALKAMSEAARLLDELSESELHEVMLAFHPMVADELVAWWRQAPQFQYSAKPSRRGFRAPNNLAATGVYRLAYLNTMITSLAPYERDLP